MQRRGIPLFLAISIAVVLSLGLLTSILIPTMPATAQTVDDAATRVAKNKQYLEEGQTLLDQKESLHREITNYENQKENATSEQEKQELEAKISDDMAKVDQIDKQLSDLEKLNKELYKVDPDLEAKLYSVEKQLIEKYLDNNSQTYIGENPVEVIQADLLTRSIVIIVDPDKVAADGSNIPSEKSIDDIPVNVIQSKIEPMSCSPASRTGTCSPLKGGISVSEQSLVPNSLNTLSYKATRSGQLGFVIAGHTGVAALKYIVQPHTDATRVVGQVQAICLNGHTCDFAWVAAASGITVQNHIYGSSDTSPYAVTSVTPDSGQTVGTFVYLSGVSSGLQLKNINTNSPNVKYNTLSGTAVSGDSGAPIFLGSGFSANLYGELYSSGGGYIFYFPQDYIQAQIGAVPSTS